MAANHEDLIKAKLRLEIKQLSLDIRETRKRLDQKSNGFKTFLSDWGPAFLTPITIISVVAGIYFQSSHYLTERQRANTFQITSSFLDLMKMLNTDNKRMQEMGYLSFTHFGKDALPYLLNHIEYTDRLERVVWVINTIKDKYEVDAKKDIFEPLKLSAMEISDNSRMDETDIKGYRNIINAMAMLNAGVEKLVIDFITQQKNTLVERRARQTGDTFELNEIISQMKVLLGKLNQG